MKRIPNENRPARVAYGETAVDLMDKMVAQNADVGFAQNGEVIVFQKNYPAGKAVTVLPAIGDELVGDSQC